MNSFTQIFGKRFYIIIALIWLTVLLLSQTYLVLTKKTLRWICFLFVIIISNYSIIWSWFKFCFNIEFKAISCVTWPPPISMDHQCYEVLYWTYRIPLISCRVVTWLFLVLDWASLYLQFSENSLASCLITVFWPCPGNSHWHVAWQLCIMKPPFSYGWQDVGVKRRQDLCVWYICMVTQLQ